MSVIQVVQSRVEWETYAEEILGCGHKIQTCDRPMTTRICEECKQVTNIDWRTKVADPFHKGYQEGLAGLSIEGLLRKSKVESYNKRVEGFNLGVKHRLNGKRLKGYY